MSIEIKISKKPVEYYKAFKTLEKRHLDVINNKKPELIWILEHPSVFTAGVSFKDEDLLDKTQKIIKTNRGGRITYHGPGQLVFYVVINLKKRKQDIRWFINILENTLINTLRNYKVVAKANRKNVGIWVKHKRKIKKIAAIGIKIKKWVAYHGFSLNINVNLKEYKKIIPCGLKNRNVINLVDIINKKPLKIKNYIIYNFLNNLED
tara:strand:- start:1689 stop:2309 length:621 start_codon:yes stop_codon:yes gene_type:complete